MLEVKDIQDTELYAKWLIYGPPGVGKTYWVAENLPNPIWYDFERSTDTLKRAGFKDIPVVPVGPSDNPEEVVRHIKKSVRDGKTIVIDTISSSQIFQLGNWMEGQPREFPLFQDYRKSTNYFSDLFFYLQHQDIHVVLIAHEREIFESKLDSKGNEYQKLIAVVPDITPALQKAVRQLVSGVFRLQSVKAKKPGEKPGRSMLCNSKGLYIAKNRYGVTEDEVMSPTWDTFMT